MFCMKKNLVILTLTLIFVMGFAGARIEISKPNDIYNLGDIIYLSVVLNPGSISGAFYITLNCENNSLDVYRIIPALGHFAAGEEQTINHQIILTPEYIGDMDGSCQITASLGGEKIATQNFIITDDVSVNAKLDKISYNPGEAMTLEIEAVRADGHMLNGFLEVSGAIAFSKNIENGIASETFSMPDTIEAGEYFLNLFVYDAADGQVLNQVNSSLAFNINAVPSFIDTSLENVEVEPGQSFNFNADLYDRSGKTMEGIISVIIFMPEDNEKQISVNSGESASIEIETNATPGIWRLFLSFRDISDEKEFEVLAVPKAEFEFLGSILVVKNIGNTIYNRTITIQIGDEKRDLELNIKVGEERRFNLNAPDGEYNVQAGDGVDSIEKNLILTGSEISIDRIKGLSILTKFPIVWVFVIAILGAIAVFLYAKFKHNTFKIKDKMKKISSKLSRRVKEENYENALDNDEDKGIIDITKSEVSEAESCLVLKGEKHNSAVLVLKVENLNDLNENAKRQLAELLGMARAKKGMVELTGKYMTIIFSPLITKTYKNEITAAKVGQEILKKLEDYNKKSGEKIKFGIGINSGDLISSVKDGKLQYTSVSGAVLLAKKIADSGEGKGKLLVSQDLRKKIMRDLKVDKSGKIGNSEIYSVVKITDREANQEKLKDILKRMGKD